MSRLKNRVGGLPVIIVIGHVFGTEMPALTSSPQAASSTDVFNETQEPLIWTGILKWVTYPILAAGTSSGRVEL